MMNVKKIFFTLLISIFFACTPFTVGAISCPDGSIRSSADSLAECNIEKDDSLMTTVKTGINVAIGLVALVAVIMVIAGGLQFTTSQGDPQKTKKARDTILYGIIGVVVAILAFAIVNFVLVELFHSGIKS